MKEVLPLPIAKLNGTSLYYEINGTGTPVVFIHGHGLTHSMFKPQLEYFSDKYKVILCDLRGMASLVNCWKFYMRLLRRNVWI